MRIEFAGNEKLRWLRLVERAFVKDVLQMPPEDVLLSDESRLCHFSPPNDVEAARGEAGGGKMRFVTRFKKGGPGADKDAPWQEREWQAYPVYFRVDVLRRAEETFGVDIAPVYGECMPDILLYISTRLTEAKRRELEELFGDEN